MLHVFDQRLFNAFPTRAKRATSIETTLASAVKGEITLNSTICILERSGIYTSYPRSTPVEVIKSNLADLSQHSQNASLRVPTIHKVFGKEPTCLAPCWILSREHLFQEVSASAITFAIAVPSWMGTALPIWRAIAVRDPTNLKSMGNP